MWREWKRGLCEIYTGEIFRIEDHFTTVILYAKFLPAGHH